ncbi:hypothetical protein HYW74_02140 [Candidatus Pacearchaeota archaeon]|nr:hypothetical protein [Candidatus Pacearchaeota archaeon]
MEIKKSFIKDNKNKLQDLSNLFRKGMKERNISFEELLKRSRKIRKKIVNE